MLKLVWHDHDMDDEEAEQVALLEYEQWATYIGHVYQSETWGTHTRTGPWRAWYSSSLGGVGIGKFETQAEAMKAIEDRFAAMGISA